MPKPKYSGLGSLIDAGSTLEELFESAKQRLQAKGEDGQDIGEGDQLGRLRESKVEKRKRIKTE